jgi:hypothetical protein
LVTFEEKFLIFCINQKSNFWLLGKRDGFSIRRKCVFDPSLRDDGGIKYTLMTDGGLQGISLSKYERIWEEGRL